MIPRAVERKRRLEATFDAGTAERRNRPTNLIVAAAVFLTLAVVFLSLSYAHRSEARGRLLAAEATMQELVDIRARVEAYQNDDTQRALERRYRPVMRSIRSRLESIARKSGLGDTLPQLGQISDERRLGLDSPLLLRTIDATINGGDHDAVLEWIQTATDEVDGLFVTGVSLTPMQTGWRMTIKLSRWEKDQ